MQKKINYIMMWKIENLGLVLLCFLRWTKNLNYFYLFYFIFIFQFFSSPPNSTQPSALFRSNSFSVCFNGRRFMAHRFHCRRQMAHVPAFSRGRQLPLLNRVYKLRCVRYLKPNYRTANWSSRPLSGLLSFLIIIIF